MQTQDNYLKLLKLLRENGEEILLSAFSNITPTYTHDSIIITTNKRATFEILKKYQEKISEYAGLAITLTFKPLETRETTENKLEKLFGEKLVVE
jgi:hypothetical protein